MSEKPELVASFAEEEVVALDKLVLAVLQGKDDVAYKLIQKGSAS